MTPLALPPMHVATPAGHLLVLAIIVPVAAVLAILAAGPRHARSIALFALAAGSAVSAAVLMEVVRTGNPLVHVVGGWLPPLGLALRADGLSATLMVMTAAVISMVGIFAAGPNALSRAPCAQRSDTTFWPLLLTVWCGLSTVFTGEDLFTLYVALELLTFAAVPMVSLDGRSETTAAALQYLIFAMVGSLLYLLGVALIYGAVGTLDVKLLSTSAQDGVALSIALSLMVAGLLAKTALFPLHIWLPPAHAGARAPASAILSALVVKAPVFLIARLLVDVASPSVAAVLGQILAVLGAASILVCGVLALRQSRLKLMIAYSTVAQLGYLFIVFPLAAGTEHAPAWTTAAWTAGTLQLASHAFAKSAMFLAAGVVAAAYGHDRIGDLQGIGRLLPLTAATFVLAGLSLVGIPPSGGFTAKYMLLSAAVATGQYWLVAVITLGGLLAAGYVFRLIGVALADPVPARPVETAVPRRLEAVALLLAVCAILLGLVPLEPSAVLQIGRVEAHP